MESMYLMLKRMMMMMMITTIIIIISIVTGCFTRINAIIFYIPVDINPLKTKRICSI
jgi:hypothetical protein